MCAFFKSKQTTYNTSTLVAELVPYLETSSTERQRSRKNETMCHSVPCCCFNVKNSFPAGEESTPVLWYKQPYLYAREWFIMRPPTHVLLATVAIRSVRPLSFWGQGEPRPLTWV